MNITYRKCNTVLSQDVPVTCSEVGGHHLVSLSSNFGARVTIEDLQALNDVLFVAWR